MTSLEKRLTALALTAALAFRIVVAWAPMDWLVRQVLGDDPFYYFTIARNLGAGSGFTFDGVAPTNGFHPLWLLVITPVFRLARDPVLAVHVVLTIAACIDVVALFLFQRLLRAAGVRAPVTAAFVVLYALSPIVLSSAGPLNGLETPLDLALTFAFLIEYRRAFAGPAPGAAAGIRLGVWSGLLFLARTDNAILLACCHGALLWRARRGSAGVRAALAPVVVAGLLAAPWLTWSALEFGSVIQVSGLAAAHVTRALAHPRGWTAAALAAKLAHNVATLAAYVPIYRINRGSFVGAAGANAAILLALAAAAAFGWRSDPPEDRRRLRAALAPWVPPLFAALAFVVIHTLRAVELRGWYYTGLVPIANVVLAIVASHAVGGIAAAPRAARPALAAVAAALAVMLAASLRAGAAPRCGEADPYAMIGAVNRRVPDGTVLGSWNAGLYGYFYARGRVVNLDGLVDNAAYDAIQSRSVGAYSARRRIDRLLDAEGAIELAAPYWDGGRAVAFPPPILDNAGTMVCRRLVLLPLR